MRYEELDFVRQERFFGIVFLVFIAGFMALDLISDIDEGAPWYHMTIEGCVVLFAIAGGVYLWLRMVGGWQRRSSNLHSELERVRGDAVRWREEAAGLSRGLTEAIDRQLDSWALSPAEKEISFLLIKGLSLKEIAEARKTSERTVRQQAATVYKKSGLEGRAQLSAFFLEDLLSTTR